MVSFGERMTAMRNEAGLSLRALARRVYADPGHLSRIEHGTRTPTLDLAGAIDSALGAGGQLVALLPAPDPMAEALRESARLRAMLADPGPDEAGEAAEHLAVAYLGATAHPIIEQAMAARRRTIDALRRARRPGAMADLTRAAGILSGVLAYAALDLGHSAAAMAHADAALAASEAAGDAELRAWTRGTQSLIARFEQRYVAALRYAQDGLAQAPGPSQIRLLCGVGQCAACLDDWPEARGALALAVDAREHFAGPGAPGVLGFSEAKQLYYTASSLMWSTEPADARRAIDAATDALDLWERGDPADRAPGDESLCRVYASTSAIHLGDLEQAAVWLAPILDLPPERRISWIRKRMDRIAAILTGDRYHGDPLAEDLRERIGEYR